MTQEELKARIEKKEIDIGKIQKRIAKWSNGLRPQDIEVCKPFGNFVYGTPEYQQAFREYKDYVSTHRDIPYSNDYNKGPNIDELRMAYRDLGEAQATLNKYKSQLSAKQDFASSEKIQVIWDFLQEWRVDAYNYFIENAKEYYKLRQGYNKALDEYLATLPSEITSSWSKQYKSELAFEKKYYSNIHPFTRQIALYGASVDEDKLNKELDKEVEAKYKNLVYRIQEKAGDIVDATGLYIGGNGEINGVVIGTKNKVRVETITAGGYNIQCLHFRVLVHIIK